MAIGEHCWPATEHIMGWDIKDNGFGVVLSPELPSLLRRELRPVLDEFLARNGLEFADFEVSPASGRPARAGHGAGGSRRDKGDLIHSWEVLREYGNMSSATALFILERALRSGARGPHLLAAFGPGFSAYFVVD